jgi:hypothetical protein
MACYAARWLCPVEAVALIFRQADPLRCPAVDCLRHAFSAPISPNLYWGKQKLGVSAVI